jgi:hypothetical protein
MTDRFDLDMATPFEKAVAAALRDHAARAAGAPRPDAVAAAVAIGPAAVRGPRWRRMRMPRTRLFALAGLALVGGGLVAGLIGSRLLTPPAPVPAGVLASIRVYAKGVPGPIELWNTSTERFEQVVGGNEAWISPDGLRAAYDDACSACDLLVTTLPASDRSSRPAFGHVELSTGGWRFGAFAWSPDSRLLAREANDSLEIVDVLGDPTPARPSDPLPRRTVDVHGVGSAWDLAWSPDGRSIAFLTETGDIAIVDVPSGTMRLLTTDNPLAGAVDGASHVAPQLTWSPDGGSLLTTDWNHPVIVTTSVPASLRTLPVSVAVDPISGTTGPVQILGWAPDGRVLLSGTSASDADVLGAGVPSGGCDSSPAWSADGGAAQVVGGDLRVGTLGGTMQSLSSGLCPAGQGATVTWSRGGDWIAVETGASAAGYAVVLVPSTGGTVVPFAHDDRIGVSHEVFWIPVEG